MRLSKYSPHVCAVYEGVNEFRLGKSSSPPGTGGVARRAGVVAKSKWFSLNPMNEWGGELFDPSTTPALRATLLFQEGSCSSLFSNSFTASMTAHNPSAGSVRGHSSLFRRPHWAKPAHALFRAVPIKPRRYPRSMGRVRHVGPPLPGTQISRPSNSVIVHPAACRRERVMGLPRIIRTFRG